MVALGPGAALQTDERPTAAGSITAGSGDRHTPRLPLSAPGYGQNESFDSYLHGTKVKEPYPFTNFALDPCPIRN
jgi:hypothetical protein